MAPNAKFCNIDVKLSLKAKSGTLAVVWPLKVKTAKILLRVKLQRQLEKVNIEKNKIIEEKCKQNLQLQFQN